MQRGLPVLAVLIFAASTSVSGQSGSTQQEAQKTAAPASAAAAPAYVIPQEFAKKPNPVKSTPESIAEGKKMYGYDCAMCHGAGGDGRGDLAGDMKLSLKDFRDPATLKDVSDGEMYYVILKGKAPMVGEEGRQKPDEIWDMINYVRSLAKKSPPTITK